MLIDDDDKSRTRGINRWTAYPKYAISLIMHLQFCLERSKMKPKIFCLNAMKKKKTWKECVDDDMKVLGLHSEWAVFRDVWMEGLHMGKRLTLAYRGRNGCFQNTWWWWRIFFSNVIEKRHQRKTQRRSSVRSKRVNLLRPSIRRPPLQLLRRRPSTSLRNQSREPTNWRRPSSDVFTLQILSYNLVSRWSDLEVYGFDCNPNTLGEFGDFSDFSWY